MKRRHLGGLIEELDMTGKKLKFKEEGNSSYVEFIKRLSADPSTKERFKKAIYLIYALMGKRKAEKNLYHVLNGIFSDSEITNNSYLIDNKREYHTNTFDDNKMKNSWYIKLKYFEWVTELLGDEDFVFFPDKYNTGQFIKEEEFKYLAFKLTEVLVKRGGYNTITRSFFLRKDIPFNKSYYKATGRKMTKGKFAHMVSVLSERDIVYCYRRPNKPNLFVVGKENPYFQLYDVVTNEDISNIYSKYHIDTTDHFKIQTGGKNLIPGKKEKEFRKQRLEVMREKAREEAIRKERDKQEKDRLIDFNKRHNIDTTEVDEDDCQKERDRVIAEWKNRKAV